MGTNMTKLVAARMAVLAIPPGGTIADGMRALADKDRLKQLSLEAYTWARAAVDAITKSPNYPFGEDEEAIAAGILQRIGEEDRAVKHASTAVDAQTKKPLRSD